MVGTLYNQCFVVAMVVADMGSLNFQVQAQVAVELQRCFEVHHLHSSFVVVVEIHNSLAVEGVNSNPDPLGKVVVQARACHPVQGVA